MTFYRTISVAAVVFTASVAVVFVGSVFKDEPVELQPVAATAAAPVAEQTVTPAAQVVPAAVALDNLLSITSAEATAQEALFEQDRQSAATHESVLYASTESNLDARADYSTTMNVDIDMGSSSGTSGSTSYAAASAGSFGSGPSSSGSSSGDSSGGSSSGGSSGSGATTPADSGGGDSGGGAAPGTTPSDTTPSGTGSTASGFKDVTVTVLSSMERLLRDDTSASGTSSAQIFCAKNETEAFQVIVTNNSYYSVYDVEFTVSDWQGPAGVKKPKMTLFREHYVQITKPSYGLPSDTPVGWYPDALIPFVDPYTDQPITSGLYRADHATVSPRTNQGYWADVRVDADVPAGTYTCSLLVTSSRRYVAEIPVTLTVWDFELPRQRQFITWYYGFYDIHQYYGLQRASGQSYNQLMDRHRDMAYEHGVYPIPQHIGVQRDSATGVVTFTAQYSTAMKQFVEKYGTGILTIPTSFLIETYPDNYLGQFTTSYKTPSDTTNPTAAMVKNTLACYNDFSERHPEFGIYVVYIDEPWTPARATAVKKIKELMLSDRDGQPGVKVAPSLKLMITGEKYVYDIIDAEGERCADLWVIYGHKVAEAGTRDGYTVEQLVADFVMGQNGQPNGKQVSVINANPFIDSNLLAYCDFAWYGYQLGAAAGFGWQLTDPYTAGQNNWVSTCGYDANRHGYGYHIYPGPSSIAGISNIGGPVASMRLKMWRRACQDFEYFKLLESLTDKETVELVVSNVVDSFYTCANPHLYAAARRTVAQKILECVN